MCVCVCGFGVSFYTDLKLTTLDVVGGGGFDLVSTLFAETYQYTQQRLYNMVHYSTVLGLRQFTGGPQECCIIQKCTDYIEK